MIMVQNAILASKQSVALPFSPVKSFFAVFCILRACLAYSSMGGMCLFALFGA